jgi:AICAR transformylase/IMP cyclohydrolase PurH
MPNAEKYAKAKAKKLQKEAMELLAQQDAKKNPNKTDLTSIKAAMLVDKNSRTIMKLSQLLAVYNKPGASELDDCLMVAHRIERYKHRISRRLEKLAKVGRHGA